MYKIKTILYWELLQTEDGVTYKSIANIKALYKEDAAIIADILTKNEFTQYSNYFKLEEKHFDYYE